jgi:S-sulfo-L-cysteine synthase (O-acetyl-L-serine-dependent)
VYSPDPAPLSGAGSVGPLPPTRYLRPAHDAFVERVGESPLVPLRSIVDPLDRFELLGKAEFLNPTGSVKDRAALAIVRAALEAGQLGPGRSLLDATSGNTGLSFAMLGARFRFGVTLCLPRNAHPDRLAAIQSYGAELILTDPGEGTDGAQREAHRRAEAHPEKYFLADQYNNPANPAAHYATTGPEVWRQSHGRVTHLVAGVGTGGTVSGTGRYLKGQNPHVVVVAVEPTGPIHGIEGLKHLPTARRPSTYDASVVDRTIRVETEDAALFRSRLAREEGLAVGMSAGAAVAAAVEVGRENPGSVVVAILPDGGHRPLEVV